MPQNSTWRSVWFLDRGIALSPGPHVPWSTPATPWSHAPLLSLSQPWFPCSVINTCDTTITCTFTVSVSALIPMFCDQYLWHHNHMHLYCLCLSTDPHVPWSTPVTPQSHAPLLSLSQHWSPCSIINTCDTTITCIFTVSVWALVPMFHK